MRKTGKWLFAMAVAAFWLIAIAVALELWESLAFEKRARRAGELAMVWTEEGVMRDMPIIEASAAATGIGPKPDVPEWTGFAELSEPDRRQVAEARGELALRCAQDGRILQVYTPSRPEHMLLLAALLKPGAPLGDALGAGMGPDAEAAVQTVATSGSSLSREYPIDLGHRAHMFEFTFSRLRPDAPDSEVLVFAGDSQFETMALRLRPNTYRGDARNMNEFYTNSLGFRDEEVTLPKPEGVYRIACIGGSTTALGPRNELTYPNLLERRLREHFGTDGIEVINCGVMAMTSRGELERFPDYLALESDLILHYNFVNDVTSELPVLLASEGWLRTPLKSARNLLRKSRFALRYFNAALLPGEDETREFLNRTTLSNMRAMADQAMEAGVEFAICSFAAPDVEHLPPEESDFFDLQIRRLLNWPINARTYVGLVELYNREVRRLCDERDLLYVPVAEGMACGRDCFADICHLYVRAMDRQAELACSGLREHITSRWKR
ncbi:MAG: hypothetical protein RLZZ303_3760 [Candidatus Hydrogenedentota bacterium]|jgi:hypothetical protein